ncbi:MAG TPA: hypothetical protein VN631_12325 [Negativicutes bacterium]|nr:hypothetical protein [Negativicutes bacterium]
MIPKDLKKDETFKEDGRAYKVLEVLADGNYISQAVEAEIEEAAEKPAEELKCQYCGREIKSHIGLQKHEAACLLNPENKDKLLDAAKKKGMEIENKTDIEIYNSIKA